MVRRTPAGKLYGAGKLCRHLLCLLGGRLRQTLASECLKLGLEDLDVAILQQGKPRRLTQLSSLEVYKGGLNEFITVPGTDMTLKIGLCLNLSKFANEETQKPSAWMIRISWLRARS
jgi:hypothetical protein